MNRALVLALPLLVACGSGGGTKPADGSTGTTNPGPPPTTASATQPATAFLSDDAIRAALTAKQEILVVRVANVEAKGAGSRSEMTTYTFDVVRTAVGASTGQLRLSHYGPATMTAGHVYVITTREGNPMWGTKGVREWVEVAPGQEEAAANAHAAKAKALGAP